MTEDEAATPLDRAELERSSLGDAEFEKELLTEFLGGVHDQLSALVAALTARDVNQVRMVAHSLKGACWTVGARAMGQVCEELELEARAGGLASADGLVARIHDAFAQLDAHVRRHWAL